MLSLTSSWQRFNKKKFDSEETWISNSCYLINVTVIARWFRFFSFLFNFFFLLFSPPKRVSMTYVYFPSVSLPREHPHSTLLLSFFWQQRHRAKYFLLFFGWILIPWMASSYANIIFLKYVNILCDSCIFIKRWKQLQWRIIAERPQPDQDSTESFQEQKKKCWKWLTTNHQNTWT